MLQVILRGIFHAMSFRFLTFLHAILFIIQKVAKKSQAIQLFSNRLSLHALTGTGTFTIHPLSSMSIPLTVPLSHDLQFAILEAQLPFLNKLSHSFAPFP